METTAHLEKTKYIQIPRGVFSFGIQMMYSFEIFDLLIKDHQEIISLNTSQHIFLRQTPSRSPRFRNGSLFGIFGGPETFGLMVIRQ